MKWNDIMIGTMGILPGSISNMTVAFVREEIFSNILILMNLTGYWMKYYQELLYENKTLRNGKKSTVGYILIFEWNSF